jgi:tetratricopeptide (TPR) repeat protein
MKVNPQARPAFRKYLNAIRAAQRVNEAEVELRRLISEYPENPNPRNYWAVMLHLEGRVAVAQRVWQEVIATWPKYAPAHSNLGYAYQLEGKLDQAVLEYKLAIELEPDNSIAAYNNLADIYMGRGDFSNAIQHLEIATRLEGYLSIPYATLGHCYAAQGRIEAAIASYQRSLECEPGVTTNDTRMEVLNSLAKLYLGQHQAERAKECCQQALSRSVNNPDALTTLGQAYFQLGEYPLAVEMFRQALSVSPMSLRNLLVHKHLALTYYKMGHFDRAAAEYKHANSWYPDRFFGSNAPFAGADGRKVAEELVARCKADLLTKPDDPELHSQAGDGYLHLACLDDAISEYRAAVALRGDDPQLLCCLGIAYYTNDQGLMAVQCFTRARTL